MTHKVLIIGGGPAGFTAAIYAARANLAPVQFLGLQPGGQLMITTDVENYPGFAKAVQGPWLMQQMQAQAQHVGTTLLYETITSVDFSSRPFTCVSDRGTAYQAQSIIIATGAQAKWLGIPGEMEFRGFGVSACATCDGFFFKDKKVVVIGGGNTAVEEALYLTNHTSSVTLIHRRDELRAEKIAQDRLIKNPHIRVIWDTVVDEIIGIQDPVRSVTGVRLNHLKTQTSSILETDGVFVAIGHTPMSSLFTNQVNLDEEGYIQTFPNSTATSVPGVFAAGDVQDKAFRQAVTAAGQGCMAALEAERFLKNLD